MSSDGEGDRLLVSYDRLLLESSDSMRFECGECGKRFYHRSNLSNHMRTHADRGSTPLQCHLCRRGFMSESELQDHSRIEHGQLEPHFVCHFCRRTFSQKAHLRSHLATHSPDAPYTCELCGQSFPKKIRLRQHYKSHSLPMQHARSMHAIKISRKQQKHEEGNQHREDEVGRCPETVQLD